MAENGNDVLMCVPITGAEKYLIVGEDVAFVFNAADGEQLAIRLKTAGLGQLRTMVWDAMVDAEAQRMPAGTFAFKVPQSFQVGHSDNYRNHVVLSFDSGSPGSANFMIEDNTAIRMCQMIGENIGKRNAALRNGIATPRKGLILPGG